jgi:exosortase A-associated hydrolase 2
VTSNGNAPRPFFLRFSAGTRFCLLHGPDRGAVGAVLYVHPLAEEMNKSRRMAALQARALAASGWAVLQVDLFGCGDSDGDFGDADWQRWLADVDEARDWLRAETGREPVLWGLRAGCLLASAAATRASERAQLVLWQPVISGRQHLTQWLRLGVASRLLDASAADRSGTRELQARFARGEAVEIAGYRTTGAMAAGLEHAELAPPAAPSRIAWLEVAGGDDATLAPASRARIDMWRAQGHDARGHVVKGLPFWQTQEIAEVPALVAATTAVLSEWRA